MEEIMAKREEKKNMLLNEMYGIRIDKSGFATGKADGEKWLFEYFREDKVIHVPDDTDVLNMNCFEDNPWVEEIIFPDRRMIVEDDCFMNCPNLKKVVFPGKEISFSRFDEASFTGSENAVIYAPAGSNAEDFAKKHNVKFEAI